MAQTSYVAADLLRLDPVSATLHIARAVRETVVRQLKRKGVVIGLSGEIDSSVVAALCVRALGRKRVVALLTPEAETSRIGVTLGRELAESLGIRCVLESITPELKSVGCYRRRDEAIRSVVPEYGEGCQWKIVLPNPLNHNRYAAASLVVQFPTGEIKKLRLPMDAYLDIVAASNFKQRVRKMLEYYHAERLDFAVAGTPNRVEYDLGLFVKNGDGAADLKPIARLYWSQVHQLACYLGIPEKIRARAPNGHEYAVEHLQEYHAFMSPEKMDLCLYGKDHGISPREMAPAIGFKVQQVARAYAIIESKRRATRYLHLPPLVIDAVS